MNQFFKKVFILFILFSSVSVVAQDENREKELLIPFQPMFSFGTAYHSFQGNIQGPSTNTLLGNMGYRAGIRLNMSKNIHTSLLFSNTSFYEKNNTDATEFKSDVDAVGLYLGYVFNNIIKRSRVSPYVTGGIQSLSFKTLTNSEWTNREVTIGIPFGLGWQLDISERIDMDIALSYTLAMSDIDKSIEKAADKFMSAAFTVHYDLFTPREKELPFDDSYYADVNFKAMDVEDEDGDLIPDIDDYCHNTPIGVKVDKNGCPLDRDNDGIADYLDKEMNTKKGALVDENGVQLTDEQYHSMYSDYEAASRQYGTFYNENEIKRENYKTVDEYLVAKANAFNKAYNEEKIINRKVKGLQYKVKIGVFGDGVPANIINQYLSLDDLESITQDNGVVIYCVGSYSNLKEALSRQYALEENSIAETSILVDNNGEISDYNPSKTKPFVTDNKNTISEKNTEEVLQEDTNLVASVVKKKRVENLKSTIYRVQIGAFKNRLSDAVFVGVEDVVSVKGKDGWITYTVGSFNRYRDAVNSLNKMRARGFEDAFIITYKNGERVNLNVAMRDEIKNKKNETVEEEISKPNIEFLVQVLKMKPNVDFAVQVLMLKPNVSFTVQVTVTKESLSSEDLSKMSMLGNIKKESEGEELYRYFAGTYSSLKDANIRLDEARKVGYSDAFVFASLEGTRIAFEESTYPEVIGVYSTLDEASVRLEEEKLVHSDVVLFPRLDGERINIEETRYLDTIATHLTLDDANKSLEEAKLEYADAFISATLDGEKITVAQAMELLK